MENTTSLSSHSSSERVAHLPAEPLHRLPTLGEVLSKQTTAPVDLFSFYIYMRDQQRSVDYLDFWLDVSQHLQLCRHYVSELRRSVLFETPDLEKAGSKRSSQMLDNFELRDRQSISSERSQGQVISAFLRSEQESKHSNAHGTNGSNGEKPPASAGGTPEQLSEQVSRRQSEGVPRPSDTVEQPPRPSFMTSNFGDGSSPGQFSSPHTTVNRGDIRASAEKILYTYVLEGSERQIVLPGPVMNSIIQAIEEDGRDDPEVFDDAKDYVFQAMERDAFPNFLRSKALGNLIPPSLLIRLIVGLISMFTAFWAAFILIFLDKDRATRCWLILPFSLGVYLLMSHQYHLDPFLALAGYSEYTLFKPMRMQEPFVLQLLRKRSLMVLLWIAIIDVALICLFVFVPGKRL